MQRLPISCCATLSTVPLVSVSKKLTSFICNPVRQPDSASVLVAFPIGHAQARMAARHQKAFARCIKWPLIKEVPLPIIYLRQRPVC